MTQIPTQFLAIPGTVQKTGAIFDPQMSYEDWEKTGQTLRLGRETLKFVLGDWINFGEANYGERYAQAIDATDFDYDYLRNIAYVCRRVELSLRRDNLTFGHHQVVAPLDSEEQEYYLAMAEEEGLTRKELRERIQKDKADPEDPLPPVDPGSRRYNANVIITSQFDCIVDGETMEEAEKKALADAKKAINEDDVTINLRAAT